MYLYALKERTLDNFRKQEYEMLPGYRLSSPQTLLIHPRDLTAHREMKDKLIFLQREFYPHRNPGELYVGMTNDLYGYTSRLKRDGVIDELFSVIGVDCRTHKEAKVLKAHFVSLGFQHKEDPDNREMAVDNGTTAEDPESKIVFIAAYRA